MAYDRTSAAEPHPERTARLRQWAQRRPRVALMGEFSAGKSTLLNFLIEDDVLPTRATATEVPPVWFSHGEAPAYWVDAGGDRHPLDVADIGRVPMTARYVRIFSTAEILEHCDVVDTPGISDPNLAVESWRFAAGIANMVLWCTSATQAWRETERATWASLPERLRRHSLLVVTRADKLVLPGDRDKVARRLARETAGVFRDRVFMATPDAVRAKEELAAGESSPLWDESGAADLLDRLANRFEDIYKERAGLLARHLGQPVEEDLAEANPVAALQPEPEVAGGPVPTRPVRVQVDSSRRAPRPAAEEAEALRARIASDFPVLAPVAGAGVAGEQQQWSLRAERPAVRDETGPADLSIDDDSAAVDELAEALESAAEPVAAFEADAEHWESESGLASDAKPVEQDLAEAEAEHSAGAGLVAEEASEVEAFDLARVQEAVAMAENAEEEAVAEGSEPPDAWQVADSVPADAAYGDVEETEDAAETQAVLLREVLGLSLPAERDPGLEEPDAEHAGAEASETAEDWQVTGDDSDDAGDAGLQESSEPEFADELSEPMADDQSAATAEPEEGPDETDEAQPDPQAEDQHATAAPYLLDAAHAVGVPGTAPAVRLWREIVARTALEPGNAQVAAMIEELLAALAAEGMLAPRPALPPGSADEAEDARAPAPRPWRRLA